MTFHAPILTPRAFDAIVSQMAGKGHFEAEIDGWTAFFDLDVDSYGGTNERHEVCACTVAALVGAWREDGNLFAGNRAEVAALVGDTEVKRWEAYAAGVAA